MVLVIYDFVHVISESILMIIHRQLATISGVLLSTMDTILFIRNDLKVCPVECVLKSDKYFSLEYV